MSGWLHGRAGGCDVVPPPHYCSLVTALPLQRGSRSLGVAGTGTPRSKLMGLDVAAMQVGVPERRGCAPQALSAASAPVPSLQSQHRRVKSSAMPNTLSEEREEARNPRLRCAV